MTKSNGLKIIVGMPAYNEGRYIGSVILQSKKYADEVLVVDDGSKDQTATIAELAGATVIRHEGNKGYGAAIQRILNEAKRKNADVLVIIDADGQHNPEEIPFLTKAVAEGFDLVVGSRKLGAENIPAYRKAGQKVLSYFTHMVSGSNISDTESGFRAYSKKALNILNPKENGMAISAEIVSEAAAKGLKATEVPVSAIYTQDGSTLNPVKHGLGNLNRILVMISERRPLLFFGLGGGIAIIGGIVAGVFVALTYYNSSALALGTALVSVLLITVGILSIFTGVILNTLVKRISDKL